MTTKIKGQYRQGDVLITETTINPAGTKQKHGGKIVLAEGESTGHAHTIECKLADWWKADGIQIVALRRAATVSHQEHNPIRLKARKHIIRRQSEYSPAEIRSVND